jgi:hypothetical protein
MRVSSDEQQTPLQVGLPDCVRTHSVPPDTARGQNDEGTPATGGQAPQEGFKQWAAGTAAQWRAQPIYQRAGCDVDAVINFETAIVTHSGES